MNRKLVVSLAAVASIGVLIMSAVAGLALGATQTVARADSVATIQSGGVTATSGHTSGLALVTCGQAKIPLGSAGNFRVLAGSTVTNTGATVVTGNLGVSPGSAVTGFPPGTVTGSIHKADTAAAHGQRDLVKAYNNGMGRTNCAKSVHGNIGGQTLGPGLYRSTSSLAISSGDLTLTAHGHSSRVFIFQVVTKFTMTSGRHVILAGGARADNIYWVVGSSATLGTTAVLYGNILAHKSVSMANLAKLHGRALAHVGAVTFVGDHVSRLPHSVGAHSNAVPMAATMRPFP